jgi:hypothetical protein
VELLKAPIPLGPEVLVSHANAALSTVHFVVRTPTGTIRRMPEIEKVTLTSPVRVRDMPHNPHRRRLRLAAAAPGRRPPKFHLEQRRTTKSA